MTNLLPCPVCQYPAVEVGFKFITCGNPDLDGRCLGKDIRAETPAEWNKRGPRCDASAPSASPSAETSQDWRDDPSADERWNAGVDHAMKLFCSYLEVNPDDVRWDAATETVDGDIHAVIGNILRAKFGEDWDGGGNPSTATSGDAPTISVRPMALSDDRTDYFVSIKVGDREITPYVFRDARFKAEYEAASFRWLLLGEEKPDLMAYSEDRWPIPMKHTHACRTCCGDGYVGVHANLPDVKCEDCNGTGRGPDEDPDCRSQSLMATDRRDEASS